MDDLITRLMAAMGPDRALDAEIARDVMGMKIHDWPNWVEGKSCMHDFSALHPTPAYTASIDAAVTLISDDDPWSIGWETSNPHGMAWVGAEGRTFTAATPALSVVIAALRARGAA
jgi:hypothetical protein